MSGFEAFFAVLSALLMLSAFWVRVLEERDSYMVRIQQKKRYRHNRHS